MFSNAVEWFVLLTCFHHSHFLLHVLIHWWGVYDFRTGWGKSSWCSVIGWKKVVAHHWICDMKSCSDGISMIIAPALFMYQVDYNKLQLSHPILDENMLLELCCNLWASFCVCLYLLLFSFIWGVYIFHSMFFEISLWPLAWLWFLTCL